MSARLGCKDVLSGRYEVERILGQGGMGAVYLARDLRLPRVWAIKEMGDDAADPAERQEAVAAFEAEAHLLSELEHPNLPRITDFFSEGGRHYLVMDFVEGRTLEGILAERGRLPVGEALDLADQLLEVLEYLHGRPRPVIFRDLKPANIILSPQGQVRLIDFGIARFFQSGKASDTRAMGTPGYAAPEQYGRGQSDARTDLYALGATLHHALSGRDPATTPFQFPPLRSLNPEVPAPLEEALLRATHLDPQQRFPDAASFRAAIQALSRIPALFPHLPERLRTGPLPAPPALRFEPPRLDLGLRRRGETIRAQTVLKGAGQGRLVTAQPWLRVSPTRAQGEDVPVQVTVYTASLANGGRFRGEVRYEGAGPGGPQGVEGLEVQVELVPVRIGCWALALALLLVMGSPLPGLGLVPAACLWLILLFTPSHERATLWPFVLVATILSLVSAAGAALVLPGLWEWIRPQVQNLPAW